jgi:hypothetical protein
MKPDAKRYWKITGYDSAQTLFEKVLPLGCLSKGEMTTLLQRLAAADLTPDEIIGASLRKNSKSYVPLLEPHQEGSPPARRFYISVGAARNYVASVWTEDELGGPEIGDG